MKVYKLYGSSTTTANAVAQLDIQRNGNIVALSFSSRGVTNAADSHAQWEVSFASAGQYATNDTVGPIGEIWQGQDDSQRQREAWNHSISGFAIPVGVGDRLYLHTYVSGTFSGNNCAVYVYVME